VPGLVAEADLFSWRDNTDENELLAASTNDWGLKQLHTSVPMLGAVEWFAMVKVNHSFSWLS